MIERNELNRLSTQRVKDYQNLDIHGTKVVTPYFMNNIERFWIHLMEEASLSESDIREVRKLFRQRAVPYGWYRGKGTPEEIRDATLAISEEVGLPLNGAGEKTILDFMKLYGLGVDCSGFVYNVLNYAFNGVGEDRNFRESLDWGNTTDGGVDQAGVFVFAGSASDTIDPENVDCLDLVLVTSRRKKKYVHMALILAQEDGLILTQSVLSTAPSGINVSRFNTVGNQPVFEFSPEIGTGWDQLFKEGNIEFRRLKIMK